MSSISDAHPRQGWTSSPDGRGMLDILWSCAFTTFLCSWTVLTLNVHAKGTSPWKLLRRKLKWMGPTLFGPEFLFTVARAQWSIARTAVRKAKSIGVEWTMRQAFFADMGGVRIKLRNEEFPVTSKQLLLLLEHGLISLTSIRQTITQEAIDYKSKSDGFTKLFTSLQTACKQPGFSCNASLGSNKNLV